MSEEEIHARIETLTVILDSPWGFTETEIQKMKEEYSRLILRLSYAEDGYGVG